MLFINMVCLKNIHQTAESADDYLSNAKKSATNFVCRRMYVMTEVEMNMWIIDLKVQKRSMAFEIVSDE